MNADDILERAAQMLETRAGNEIYRKAWRRAASLIRSLKANAEVNQRGAEVNCENASNHVTGKSAGHR